MKLGIFLVLLGCCLYLTAARPNDSDSDDDNDKSPAENSNEEFDESGSEFEFGNESDDDDWIGDVSDTIEKAKEEENEGLNDEQVKQLEKMRRDQIQSETEGKAKFQTASRRLMKEIRDIYKSESYKSGAYTIEQIDESIYNWFVYLRHIDSDSDLYKDLQQLNKTTGQDCIILNFKFKETFPHTPPFVRVVAPVITRGHVMQGGAICTELLSSDGWSSVYTVEAIIMQISTLLVKGDGRIPPQTKHQAEQTYTEEYARQALERMEKTHKNGGWGNHGKD